MPLNTVTKEEVSVQTTKISEDVLIKGILNNDSKVLRQIYSENFVKIKVMVLNFKNVRIDPQDVFQEGLTRAVVNVRQNKFNAQSKFSTYLYSICHNICLKEYQKQYKESIVIKELDIEDDSTQYFELLQFVLKIRDRLDETCKQIIDLRFNLNENQSSTRFEYISEKLGIMADNARQRFRRCLNKLIEQVNDHPGYKSLFE
ncbi:MAG: sigma-70 family RNA polymerase sigma factor [Bacteroidales bacterium]|jgi:RNA polymerase sigma factor (sigma-70 family)|nr:sigma-70 family RNA polymerase sigma factor [Bacteroidales bacterium]